MSQPSEQLPDPVVGILINSLNTLLDVVLGGDQQRALQTALQMRQGALGQMLSALRDLSIVVPQQQQQLGMLAGERDRAQAALYRLQEMTQVSPNGAERAGVESDAG